MNRLGARHDLLRPRQDETRNRVTNIELFFDLVFVFAITQLSHTLLQHLSLLAALQVALLFGAVWQVWIYTVWVTNWLDPETTPVRLMLFLVMAGGLVMAASIPAAFGSRGVSFALVYVALQVGRSLFMLWALRAHSPGNFRNYRRITVTLLISAVFWLLGAALPAEPRLILWLVALGLELAAALVGFWIPGLGRSRSTEWDVDGGHIAERCGAFILIALGESITIIGASFFGLTWSGGTAAGFAVALLGTAAMWWIYFDTGAEHGARAIAGSSNPGRLASLAYHDLHALLVAGVVVCAVSDELVLAEPEAATGAGALAILLGGPALYLLGNLVFKAMIRGRYPLSHLVGLGLFGVLAAVAGGRSLLVVGTAAVLVLVVLAVWETRSLRAGTSP
jgi:low temperature requirement protein LtrA